MSRTSRRNRALGLGAVIVAAGALVACSDSAALSGQALIEGELADTIGLGDLDATCNEPDGLTAGETFTCTATTDGGATIELLGTMTSDDEFEVVTTNLLVADDVVAIREDAASALSAEVGQEISSDDIVCPDEIVVLDESGTFTCEITDTSTGDVFELTISTGGLEPGVGARDLQYSIGDAPL